MYEISNYSGKIRNTITNEVFTQDDSLPQWEGYWDWRKNNEIVYVDFFAGEELEKNQKRAIEIDFEYTDRIFIEIEIKHVGRNARDSSYVWPQSALDEIALLRAECNAKIFDETGITDYSYRQSIPKLATFNINP